jgi:hypothetical protein
MTTIVIRRIYFYAAAFLGLQLLVSGASGLLSALIERLIAPSALGAPEMMTERLSASLALLLVGLPLWVVHWLAIQRMARRPEEQHARLRRVYAYLVLVLAAIAGQFALYELLDVLFGAAAPESAGAQAASAIGSLVPQALIWWYHWRVFAADRDVVEPAEGTATLRRWYMLAVLAVSLGTASVGAADLIHRLLQQALAPGIGASGIGGSLALLAAGLAVWLPHHLWWRWLVRAPTPLRADERRSTLRQIYMALVILASAVAALGGMAALLYALLLVSLGGATWQSLLAQETWGLAAVAVGAPLWWYHRRLLADEARLSEEASRADTAERLFGYLMAAIGVVALFFGLGQLLGTLLRMLLAPDVIGAGWREPLSFGLALSAVALPVYSLAARATERRARQSHAEDRMLARRLYLYAALLFGVVAAIGAAVSLLQLLLGALLGMPNRDLAGELGRWAGYTLVGVVVATIYALILRRASRLRSDIGAGLAIAIVADEPLQQALVAACAREAPKAAICAAHPDQPSRVGAAIGTADLLVITFAAALAAPLAEPLRGYGGPRLLVPTGAPGYDLAGPRHGDAALARAAAQALRAALSDSTPIRPRLSPAPAT